MAANRRRILPFAETRERRWKLLASAAREIGDLHHQLEWRDVAGLAFALRSPLKWGRLIGLARWLLRTNKARKARPPARK